ncbi:MAG: ATPase [Bacteroidetes bacterium]|nr:MAG: ATPase [Bacteroidota bacterium]
MIIERKQKQQILDLLGYFPVVGIVGPRQVGKTTLAKSLINKLERKTIYIDLEYPEDLNKLTDPVLFFQQNTDKCIIIDEVQRKPDLFPVLRSIIDQKREAGRFILLGSASPEMIRDTSESLAGRIAYIELSPFNLPEINKLFTYDKHWFFGGFPNALLAPNPKLSKIWLQQFVQTYIERDLPMLGFPGSPQITSRLWQMLAHYNGNLWNATSFANALDISVPTVNRYIDFFEEAFLIRRLQPWGVNAKKRLVKSSKIYIRDTGLLHYLAGISDFNNLQGNMLIGSSWENYVIEQIYQLLPSDFKMYFYRTQAGAEADLIIVKGIEPIYCIEIKYSSNPKVSKGLMNVIKDLETKKNYIITPISDTYSINEFVTVTNLQTFINEIILKLTD